MGSSGGNEVNVNELVGTSVDPSGWIVAIGRVSVGEGVGVAVWMETGAQPGNSRIPKTIKIDAAWFIVFRPYSARSGFF